LPELIDIAQRSNPATRAAWQRARDAALGVGMVESTFLPIVSATAIAGRQTVRTSLPLPTDNQRFLTTNVSGANAALTVKWLIFDFGERAAVAEAARDAALAANVLFNGAHQKLIFDVTRAYYTYSASVANLRIAREALRNSQAVADAAQARMANGLGTSVEVAQARQLVAQARLRVVRAEGQERDTYQLLLAAMGVSATEQLKVQDVSRRPLPSPKNVPLDAMIKVALSQRPDVLASYSALRASHAGIKAAEAAFMPKVFVAGAVGTGSGSFNINNLPELGQQADGAGILVGASVPLFDGGLRLAQKEIAESRAKAAAADFQRIQSAAVTEVVGARNALRTALESYRAAHELTVAATTTYNAALAAYKNGVGTIQVATEAATGLLNARQARADAHAAVLIGAANLAFVVGFLTSRDAIP